MLKKSLILLLLIIPFASAELELTDISQNIYNLGEKIYLNAYIEQNKDISSSLKLTINCNEYEFVYFMTPLSLKKNKEEILEIPALEADSSLLGICRIIANLKSNDAIIETSQSTEFEVTKNLNVSFQTDKEEYDPGETAVLKINAITKYGYDVEVPEINVLIGSTKIASFSESKIKYNVEIPEKINAGDHSLNIEVKDENANSGEASKEITIKQIPTKITYNLNKEKFLPGDSLETRPSLYDQADNIIQETLRLTIKDSDNNIISRGDIESTELHKYKLNSNALPGKYSIKVSHKDISKESSFEVDEYLNLDIDLDGEIVTIKNTGNIPYNDNKDILVNGEKKNYIISEEINLAPGEEIQIDISQELPEGSYEVVIPIYNADTKEFKEESLENVAVHDGRSTTKKAVDGITSIVGAVVTVGGLLKPSVAAIILIIIVFGLSVYFYQKGKEEE